MYSVPLMNSGTKVIYYIFVQLFSLLTKKKDKISTFATRNFATCPTEIIVIKK